MKLQTNDADTAATLQQDLLRLYFSDACRLLDSLQAGRLSDAALTHAGLTREDIVRGTPALQFDAFFRLLDWLHDARPVPLAPLRLGLMRRLEDHGLYGRAVVSVRTFGESLRMGERFFGVSWQGVRLSVHQEGDTVVNRYVMMPSAVCRPQPLLQMLIGTSVAVTRELLPDADLSSCLAQYPFRAGQDDRGQTALLGCRTAFGSGHGSYRFPSAWLSRPITMAPALGTSQVAAVALWRARWRTGSMAQRVGWALQQHGAEGFPALDEVAATLGCSPRTLRRYLAQEGTSFQSVLDCLRMALAQSYLAHTRLSIAEIGEVLGYAHSPSFRRAFKAYFGHAPQSLRRNKGFTRGLLA